MTTLQTIVIIITALATFAAMVEALAFPGYWKRIDLYIAVCFAVCTALLVYFKLNY